MSDPDTAIMYIDCDFSYDPKIEIIKFFVQFIYLIMGIALNLVVLRTLVWKRRDVFMTNSFFVLFAVDCMINTTVMTVEGILPRFFIYVTPLCPLLSEYFSTPLIGFKIVMISSHHAIISKSIMQSFLVLNRMTCVILPIDHDFIWRKHIKFVILFVVLCPLSVDWNLAISRVYMQSTYGGFWVNYMKKVQWASQSRFQLAFIIIALLFTFICTTITLIKLPKRSKEIEKSITNATLIISIIYTCKALFQIYYSFFYHHTDSSSAIYGLSFLALDFSAIGSPIIMISVSSALRKNLFSKHRIDSKNVSKLQSRTSGIVVVR